LRDCLAARKPVVVDDLPARFGPMPGGPYDEPAHTAVVLPMLRAGHDEPHGFFIAGASPRRALDARYRTFFELARDHIVAAIGNALAYEEERKRAEALAEIDRAKTAFFSNVSHEFRTPLTLVLGPMEDALARGGLAGDDLDTAFRNALRLQKLVNALLDFSRIEAGRMGATYVPTDAARSTSELASMFESAMARAGLRYLVRCEPVAEPVYLDRDMYEKIVLNLLSNALKFTFDGEIEVALRDAGACIELKVRDTGVGVAPEAVPRLFERFHRIEGTRARTHEGSGIGLALVSELVELHGGSVSAASVLGAGTTFTVTLPKGKAHLPADKIGQATGATTSTTSVAFVEEALRWLPARAGDRAGHQVEPDAAASAPAQPAARVLVADDNADLRDYLRRVLAPHHQVEVAPDGTAALAAARRAPPDLVLTDVMMPNLDGFGLLHALRADPRTRSIPVIMLSARAGEESRVEGLQAGADDYLVKPFSARELIARVRTHLELSRLRRDAELQSDRLHALFEQVPAVICVLAGPDHVYRLANPTYLEHIGHRRVLGLPIRKALPELEGQGVVELLDQAYTTGQPVLGEEVPLKLRRNRALEDTYWNFVYQPYRDLAGRIEGVMVFGFEVTAHVVARRRAKRAEAEAEAANRAKDEFLAILGHELRNPLAPILTALHLMRLRDGDHLARERAVIERQAQHLVRLVDDLLDVSRITRGKIELKKQRVEVADVVARAIEMASPLLEQRRHDLRVEVPSQGLAVDADPDRLAQVVSNLLTNAAKYTEQGGRITLAASAGHGEIAIRVEDTGIGIAPEMLPRVFEMFVQERQALDRSRGGLGLGLTIVRSLVAMHGGSVEVRSEGHQRGAEFLVRLPAAVPATHDADAIARSPGAAPRPTGSGGRILVVDDNEDAADLLAAALEAMGHTVRVAHDGPEALKVAAGFGPDVAVLDIGLPVMDGYELARRLRELPGLERLHLVAVTGYGQDADRRRSAEAGFAAHFVKPFDLGAIESLIKQLRSASPSSDDAASAGRGRGETCPAGDGGPGGGSATMTRR
ncbi:MAG TPA: ATP-binding protein, partial [Kofleriaceae bacterium]